MVENADFCLTYFMVDPFLLIWNIYDNKLLSLKIPKPGVGVGGRDVTAQPGCATSTVGHRPGLLYIWAGQSHLWLGEKSIPSRTLFCFFSFLVEK